MAHYAASKAGVVSITGTAAQALAAYRITVVENLQVYRTRFGANTPTIEPNLHRAVNIELRRKPAWVDATPEP